MVMTAAVQNYLTNNFKGQLTSAEFNLLLKMVNESFNLQNELSQFVSVGGKLAISRGGQSGGYSLPTNTISMDLPNAAAPYAVPDPFARPTNYDSNPGTAGTRDPVGASIIDDFGHELGHYENYHVPFASFMTVNPVGAVLLNPVSLTAVNAPSITGDRLLGEGAAIWNSAYINLQIAQASHGADQADFTEDGTLNSYQDEPTIATSNTWQNREIVPAERVASALGSMSQTPYLTNYWTNVAGGIRDNPTNVIPTAAAPVPVTLTLNTTNGAIGTMTWYHNGGSISFMDMTEPGTVADTVTIGSTFTVQIVAAQNYHGRISNFITGDTIDLDGFAATSATLDGPKLQVTGGGLAFTLNLDPAINYAPYRAVTSSDGFGGTNIQLAPITATTAMTLADFAPQYASPSTSETAAGVGGAFANDPATAVMIPPLSHDG